MTKQKDGPIKTYKLRVKNRVHDSIKKKLKNLLGENPQERKNRNFTKFKYFQGY